MRKLQDILNDLDFKIRDLNDTISHAKVRLEEVMSFRSDIVDLVIAEREAAKKEQATDEGR